MPRDARVMGPDLCTDEVSADPWFSPSPVPFTENPLLSSSESLSNSKRSLNSLWSSSFLSSSRLRLISGKFRSSS